MQLSCEELELQSLIEYFYAIPGVPSEAVKPEQLRLKHHKIVIQSTSQGSRCLNKGEKILYLKEVISTLIYMHAHLNLIVLLITSVHINISRQLAPCLHYKL